MTTPEGEHWVVVKRILIYVKGSPDFGILYNISKDPRLIGFTDSNSACFAGDRMSTSGCVFSLDMGAVTWTSKK